jgi:hypothetical protein
LSLMTSSLRYLVSDPSQSRQKFPSVSLAALGFPVHYHLIA